MALGRSTGLLLLALSFVGCGGTPSSAPETPSTTTAAEPPATPSEPATAPETTGGEAPAGESKPVAGSDEKWEGEAEAAAGTPVARTKEETRTTAVIAQTIQANRKPIRDCYDKGRKELGDLKGTMTIKLLIDPDGAVKQAELNRERSEIKAPAIVNCAIDAIKKIKFPPSSRGMDTMVNYPFDFKPDGAR